MTIFDPQDTTAPGASAKYFHANCPQGKLDRLRAQLDENPNPRANPRACLDMRARRAYREPRKRPG